MAKDFGELATEESINKTKDALIKYVIEVFVVEIGEQAKAKALEMIPAGAEIMNMSSVTVDSIGLAKEINDFGRYNSVRKKFATMDAKTQGQDMKRLGATPEWAVGSVHAVTEDGKVVIVSATGSQLPAYAYGSSHVLWVVGTQKIVKDIKEAFDRVSEYVLPLESARAMKAYGQPSSVNKELVVNKEVTPGRITMILVKEKLGF